MNWFLRMTLWARRPPSKKRRQLVFGVLVICALLFAIERWIGWPDALTAERVRPGLQINR